MNNKTKCQQEKRIMLLLHIYLGHVCLYVLYVCILLRSELNSASCKICWNLIFTSDQLRKGRRLKATAKLRRKCSSLSG